LSFSQQKHPLFKLASHAEDSGQTAHRNTNTDNQVGTKEPSTPGLIAQSEERLKAFKDALTQMTTDIVNHNGEAPPLEGERERAQSALSESFQSIAMKLTRKPTGFNSNHFISNKKLPPFFMHRGPFGETLLHVACLFGEYAIAKEILDKVVEEGAEEARMLVDQPYTQQPYLGETALHIAIAKGNLKMVQLLLDFGASFEKRCIGKFFKYPGFYVGELPISFAASVSAANERNKEIFSEIQRFVKKRLEAKGKERATQVQPGEESTQGNEMAMKQPVKDWSYYLKKTDMAAGPTQGNTLLHVLVLRNNIDMYAYIAQRYPDEVAEVEETRNAAQMTPLTLCAEQGNPEFFQYLVMRKKLTHWEYGLFLLLWCLACLLFSYH